MSTALMLPGQAAAPEGPCDLGVMYVIHHGFRRDLARFVVAFDRTPLASPQTWSALARRWDGFTKVLHIHHEEEDRDLWPALEARATAAGDTGATALLSQMAAEHAGIDPALEAVRAALAAMADAADRPSNEARRHLVRTTHAAATAVHQHLAHEEADAIALLQRHLPAEELASLEERWKRNIPAGHLLFFLPWLLHDLPADVRDPMLRAADRPFRLAWRATRGRFARADRLAFAHVPAEVGAGSLTDALGDIR